jgi:hypothetical protein
MASELLTTEEPSLRISMTPDDPRAPGATRAAGRCALHPPFGCRKILYVWDAIERDIGNHSRVDPVAIPMANGGVLNG